MPTHKLVMISGLALFILMAILLRVGTTSLSLFIVYGVLTIAGLSIFAFGQRMRDRR